MRAEGWYRDPYGIHSDRWYSDGRPTNLVRDKGTESRDDPPPDAPPLPLVPVDEIQVGNGDDLLRADEVTPPKPHPMDGSGALGVGFS